MASPAPASSASLPPPSPARSRTTLSPPQAAQSVVAIVIDSDNDTPRAPSDNRAPPPPTNGVASHDVRDVADDLNGLRIKEESAKVSQSPSSPPSVAAPATSAAQPAAPPTPSKPKSKAARPARSPSPSPPPPPPPPIVRTIRLDIKLGGPDNYAVDIAQLAKETGQRNPTPPPVKRDTSESEGEDDGDGSKKRKGKGKGGKRKNLATEYYDLNDPFIDDSDLAIDERTYIAQTKQHGFYVSSGEVALLKEKSTPKKPKSKKIVPTIIPLAGSQAISARSVSTSALVAQSLATAASTSNLPPPSHIQQAHNVPITIVLGEETQDVSMGNVEDDSIKLLPAPVSAHISASSLKRKGSSESQANSSVKKKRKVVEIESFHPDLQNALRELKACIGRESFEQKGKFPPALKPILAGVALVAIRCGEYNDNFFSLMPKLFPYNKFTMTKLIKRTVFADHHKMLLDRQDELVTQLARLVNEGFPKAQEEYEKSLISWQRRQEKSKTDAQANPAGPAAGSTESTPVPQAQNPDGESEVENDGPAAPRPDADGEAAGKGAGHPPGKKYRLTEQMKVIIWELVVLSNETVRVENEKHNFEGSTIQVSEQGTRKVLYQRIVSCFPDGWMTSGQISRDVSVMKKRFEAQQQEE